MFKTNLKPSFSKTCILLPLKSKFSTSHCFNSVEVTVLKSPVSESEMVVALDLIPKDVMREQQSSSFKILQRKHKNYYSPLTKNMCVPLEVEYSEFILPLRVYRLKWHCSKEILAVPGG